MPITIVMQISSAADDASNEAMAAYGDAYAVLSDDSKREAYDKEQLSSNVSYPHNIQGTACTSSCQYARIYFRIALVRKAAEYEYDHFAGAGKQSCW